MFSEINPDQPSLIPIEKRIKLLIYSAKQRNIEVKLYSFEYESLIRLGCHYCGASLHNHTGYSLDRLNPKKGYTLHNSVGCCKICNYAKGVMTFDEFFKWTDRVHNFKVKIMKRLEENIAIVGNNFTHKDEKNFHSRYKKDNSFFIKVKQKNKT